MNGISTEDLFKRIECELVSADKTQKNGQEMLLLTVLYDGKTLKYGIIGDHRIQEVLASGRKENGKIILKLDSPKSENINWVV